MNATLGVSTTKLPNSPGHSLRLVMLVVVERLPKSDPDIEQSKPAADAANETIRDQRPQAGVRQQQVVVGPFRSPGKDDKQDTRYSADQDKQKDRDSVQPKLQPALFLW